MTDAKRKMHLTIQAAAPGHPAGWRVPGGERQAGDDVAHYQNVARLCESALLDARFWPNSPSFTDDGRSPTRSLSVRRHAGADRRLYGEVGRRGCRRRLQSVYGCLSRGSCDLRGSGDPASPEAWAFPSKLRRKNSPATVRVSAPGKGNFRRCAIRCFPFAETARVRATNLALPLTVCMHRS